MKKLLLLMALFFSSNYTFSQSVVINPDGTHSVVVGSGSVRTAINSNGTHSTIIGHGTVSTVVNSNGTHSTLLNTGTVGLILDPPDTNTTFFKKKKTFSTTTTDSEEDELEPIRIFSGKKLFRNKKKSVFGFSLVTH